MFLGHFVCPFCRVLVDSFVSVCYYIFTGSYVFHARMGIAEHVEPDCSFEPLI